MVEGSFLVGNASSVFGGRACFCSSCPSGLANHIRNPFAPSEPDWQMLNIRTREPSLASAKGEPYVTPSALCSTARPKAGFMRAAWFGFSSMLACLGSFVSREFTPAW